MYEDTWDKVEALLGRYDASIDINCASACAWSGQLRVTLTDPKGEPSRSIVFFSVGKLDPEEVTLALLADFAAWSQEAGVEPMPVPAWMR